MGTNSAPAQRQQQQQQQQQHSRTPQSTYTWFITGTQQY